MSQQAIVASDLNVRFRPYIDRKPTLRRSLARLRSRETQEVVALDSVAFEVERGEAFGIIGRNGAGKSTLLRCMAGTLRPNSGRVVVHGRTSTLLQLGVGFNPELSGRRNIVLGGLAAGLRKKDIEARVDDIIEYSGIGVAIDRPVKTYSTGMFSRLAFAVGMHLDPDVLLLDEVLAVGDESFRGRSMQAMRELLERSGTIVFVSHSLPAVASFCDRVLWLEEGRVVEVGEASSVVEAYRKAARQRATSM